MDLAANIASSIISGEIPMLEARPPASQAAQPWPFELIKSYIAAYYYAALTNVSFQLYLLPIEQVEGNNIVRSLIDESYKDFYLLDNWFATLDPAELQTNPNLHLYQEARNGWKPWVKDSTMVYREIDAACLEKVIDESYLWPSA